MKKQFVCVISLGMILLSCNESPRNEPVPTNAPPPAANNVSSPGYNPTLAAQLQADEYGMRTYVLAVVQQGTGNGIDENVKEQVGQTHLRRLEEMRKEGKLLLAGPFNDQGFNRGILIFNTASIDTARIWTATDPAIRLGQLQLEMHLWYGSAALPELNGIHDSIAQKSTAGQQ